MSASRPRSRWKKWLWIPFLPPLALIAFIALFRVWHWVVLPSAVVHYAKEGTADIHFAWIFPSDDYEGDLSPGGTTSDEGSLFPDSDFFMMLEWRKKGERRHCVAFTPKWPRTEIYLDADGNIDTRAGSGTHTEGWQSCPKGWGDL